MGTHKYMVFTKCLTYNHAPYIIDAMNGFCMQKTSFPFLITIIDDASTDGEPEIINTYLQENFNLKDAKVARNEENEDYRLIYAQHKTNTNCFFAVFLLKYNHHSIKKNKSLYYADWEDSSRYVAFCEGDDYWTDPQKLQKQVDFMDAHPEYVFCCHRFDIFEQNKNLFRKEYGYLLYQEGQDLEITEQIFFQTWITQILTTLFRKDAVKQARATCRGKYNTARDVYLFYELLQLGKGISLNQKMGVYRWHDGGIYRGADYASRYTSGVNVYTAIYKHHPNDTLLLPKIIYNYDRLLRYTHITSSGNKRLKEALSYCTTWKQKIRMTVMYISHPSFFVILYKLFEYQWRKKCYISSQS